MEFRDPKRLKKKLLNEIERSANQQFAAKAKSKECLAAQLKSLWG
jgi:hypothetical protein